jgi:hypothetical protein
MFDVPAIIIPPGVPDMDIQMEKHAGRMREHTGNPTEKIHL